MPQSPPAETSTKQSGHMARVGRSVISVGFGLALRRSARGAAAARARVGLTHAREAALRGGDDYELCFTAAATQRAAIEAVALRLALPLTRIGEVVAGQGVTTGSDTPGPQGYEHFTEL